MYFVDNNTGTTEMPALAPSQGTEVKWFTEGDGNKGISHIGQDWLNIIQAELLAILTEGKIQPDKMKLNQLTLAIKAIITANAFLRKNNLKEIEDAGAGAQANARKALGLGNLAIQDTLSPTAVGALEKSKNLSDVPDKVAARTNLGVYSKEEGDRRYLKSGADIGSYSREQSDGSYLKVASNGSDIANRSAFIDNLGLRETVNKAADALPSDGTAAAANRLATPVNINGVPFDGTRDINITSGMPESTANQRYVTGVRLGAQALSSGLEYNYSLSSGNVITGFKTDGDWEMRGGDDRVYYRQIQYCINGNWVSAASI